MINVLNFAKIFEEIQMKLLKRNITSGEQGIMTIITRKYPDIVDIPITLRGSKCAINDVLNCDESIRLWGRGAIKGFFA